MSSFFKRRIHHSSFVIRNSRNLAILNIIALVLQIIGTAVPMMEIPAYPSEITQKENFFVSTSQELVASMFSFPNIYAAPTCAQQCVGLGYTGATCDPMEGDCSIGSTWDCGGSCNCTPCGEPPPLDECQDDFDCGLCPECSEPYCNTSSSPTFCECKNSASGTSCGGGTCDGNGNCVSAPCGAGLYLSGGSCVAVGQRYWSPANDNSRYCCSAGYYGSSTTNSTTTCNGQCGANTYCESCAPGTTACPTNSSSPAGSDAIEDCDGNGGYYNCASGACSQSSANYYSPYDNDAQYACPTNSTSPAGSDALDDCDGNAGYYACSDGTCNVAGAGYYSPNDDDNRYTCSAGYYGSSTTNSASTCNGACTANYYCPAGSTSATQNACPTNSTSPAGSDAVSDCVGNAGYYNCNSGTCSVAGTGYYSPAGDNSRYACPTNSTTTTTTASALSQCVGNAGYYNCEDGTCNVAGAGYYSAAGSNSRATCSAGYYGSSTTNSVATCNGQCSANYYCAAGSTSATQNACPANSTSPAGSDALADCDGNAGYYNCSSGTCAVAGTGYYSPADDDARYACPTNSTTTTTTASALSQCLGNAGYYNCEDGTCDVAGAGYYSAANSNTRAQCAAGRYGSTTTNSASTCNGACTANYYCPAGSTSATQNACPTNSSSVAGSDALADCTGNAGYYNCEDGTCNVAGAGYYSAAGSNSRATCSAGYYGSSTTNSVATCNGQCSANYYCAAGSTSATQNACPANSTSPAGSTVIADCDGNGGWYACSDGTCNQSTAGSYSPNDDDSQYACPTGQTSPAGSDASADCYDSCGAGSYWTGSACGDVGTGYYSPANNNSRTACPTNSLSSGSGTGADALADCLGNAGYYNCQTGTCSVAGAGYYSAAGSNSRATCSANYYGSSTTNSVATCDAACPTNSTSPAGSDALNDCDGNAGWYGCDDGTCNQTAAGYYSPTDNDTQIACGSNNVYSSAGAGSCTTVSSGYYSTGGTSTTRTGQAQCTAGTYCSAGVQANCAANYYGSTVGLTVSTCTAACPIHSTSPAGSDALDDCDGDAGWYGCSDGTCDQTAAGYYSPTDNDTQIACGSNNVYSSAGAGSCTTVSSGYYSTGGTSTTRTGQSQCTAGTYCSAGVQANCAANYYGTTAGLTVSTCTAACPTNSTSPAGSDALADCVGNAGYYNCEDGTCDVAGLGYWSAAASNARAQCSANYYGSSTTNSAATCTAACPGNSTSPAGSDALADCVGICGYYDCNTGTCVAAGTGYYSTAGSNTRAQCSAGRYGSTTTNCANTCDGACTAGYYCPAGSASATANACGTGNYCPAGSGSATGCPTNSTTTTTTASALSQCVGNAGYYNCESGTCSVAGAGYYSAANSNSRATCSAGYYGSSTTNSVATCNGACTANYYCGAGSTSATQNACPANSSSPAGSGAITDCDGNGGWYACSDGTCNQSTAGSYSPNDDDAQYACPTGQTSPAGSDSSADCYDSCGAGQYWTTSCTDVGTGYYSPANNNTRTACPTNSLSSGTGTGADALDDCLGNAGYYNCQTGTCSLSSAGYYSPAGSNSQTACGSNNAYSSAGAGSCTTVSSGYYSTGGTSTTRTGQSQCTAGTYCSAGVQANCAANYYGTTAGLTVSTCTAACPTNSTSPAGSDALNDCDGNAGWYGCDDGTCNQTAAGYYSPTDNDTQIACGSNNVYSSAGAGSCTTVSSGYYSTGGTSTTRTGQSQCTAGTYCSAGVQANCPGGTYGSTAGLTSSACTGQCTANYYCPAGSTSATQNACPAGTTSPAGSDASNDCAWVDPDGNAASCTGQGYAYYTDLGNTTNATYDWCCGDDTTNDDFATYSGSLTTSTSANCRRCLDGSANAQGTLYGNGYTTGNVTTDPSLTCYWGDIGCSPTNQSNGTSGTLCGNGFFSSSNAACTAATKTTATSGYCFEGNITCADNNAVRGSVSALLKGNGNWSGTSTTTDTSGTCYYGDITCADGSSANGSSATHCGNGFFSSSNTTCTAATKTTATTGYCYTGDITCGDGTHTNGTVSVQLKGNGYTTANVTTDTSMVCYHGDITCGDGSSADGASNTKYGNGYLSGSGTSRTCYYGDMSCTNGSSLDGASSTVLGWGYYTGSLTVDTTISCRSGAATCTNGSAADDPATTLYGNGYKSGTTCYYGDITCASASEAHGSSCTLAHANDSCIADTGCLNQPASVSASVYTDKALNSELGKIVLNWTDNSSIEDGFKIERRVNGGSWSVVNTTSANATSYTDDNIDNNNVYDYQIRAYRGAAYSEYSSTVSGITADRTGPANPSFATSLPRSCAEILANGNSTGDGVYTIDPGQDGVGFSVYCDMTTDGGGWTLVWSNMKDVTGNPTTNLTWNQAVYGGMYTSGTVSTTLNAFEYLIALDKWETIGDELREDWAPATGVNVQERFYADFYFDEANDYTLKLSNYVQKIDTAGAGTAGLYSYHNNRPFSSIDDDNDANGGSCSSSYGNNPWWYGSCWDGNIGGYGGNEGAYWKGASGSTTANGNGWIYLRGNLDSTHIDLADNTTGLLLYMPFEEGAGTMARDWSVNDRNGTLVTPSYSAGGTGNGGALTFNGTTDYIITPRFSTGSTGATYSAWVKTTSTDSGKNYSGNAAQNVLGDNTNGVALGFGLTGGKIQYNLYNAGWLNVTGLTNANDGNWHYITATHATDGSVKLYLDGALDNSGTITYAGGRYINRVGGGYENWTTDVTGDEFNGSIDEVRVYNRVLTQREIINDMQSGVTRFGVFQSSTVSGTYNYLGLGSSSSNPGTTCYTIYNSGTHKGNGTYWIDPDGAGGNAAFEAYCDMSANGGGWMLVTSSMIDSQTNTGTSTVNTADANGGVIITTNVTAATGCTSNSNDSTLLENTIDWTHIRFDQSFVGSAACWSIFGNSGRSPDTNLIDFSSGTDTIENEVRMGGSTGGTLFDGTSSRCDNETINFWHSNNGTTARNARVILRRTNVGSLGGLSTGVNCIRSDDTWTYENIYVREAIGTVTAPSNNISDTTATDTTAPAAVTNLGGDAISTWTTDATPTVTFTDAVDNGNTYYYYANAYDQLGNANAYSQIGPGQVTQLGTNVVWEYNSTIPGWNIQTTTSSYSGGQIQLSSLPVDQDTWYRLEFEAKGTDGVSLLIDTNHSYPGQGSNDLITGTVWGGNSTMSSTEWRKRWVTYKTNSYGSEQMTNYSFVGVSNVVATYQIRNIRLIKINSSTVTSGIDGYAANWTQGATDVTSTTKNVEAGVGTISSTALTSASNWYLNIRSVDNAGNWDATTDTVHRGPFQIDTTTPNIVAVDAGASSGDRTSLTSATWFTYPNTGSDDAISFSWTDPASISNDTFYYELNGTATATITGDEATTTNPYIDSIAINDGVNYFHVRPRNGAGTWGTERIFIINYNRCAPPASGDWTPPRSCTITGQDYTVYGNLIIYNGVVFRIEGTTNIQFSGASRQIRVQPGGKIEQADTAGFNK